MPEPPAGTDPTSREDAALAEMGHPRGTLTIVAVYGILLALGWVAMYLAFLARGAPR